MSVIDQVVSALSLPETDASRRKARADALSISEPGDWLSLVLHHHVQVEDAFSQVLNAVNIADRLAAQGRLGVVLTGHAIAEESVLYPALAEIGEKGHADTAYSDQATVKMQMAELERLDPASQDYLEKLEHIRESVEHHVYEEEAHWFPELKRKAAPADQAKLTERYQEEFTRYVGVDVNERPRRTPSFL
jgi:hemerythrin superfamily protein